ncbi:ribulose bisphosphate carboxylase small subunit [Nodosilinea sp. LEGE 06152]|uniref:ribulose bisphosphate carboxylase small subunit n=1 Tax=Nodosilinea sp. LEGE 06152 TaxID=2777966 RepID=UPI00187F52B0|nr:ribulose bisphosphate carboxylase small subunit [Nodosilinea sp. LEGE 06152]MBE9155874.1 ribulose bisphosphate carboxylase small subunit [Nodosilinea sp. LEGE 06152]
MAIRTPAASPTQTALAPRIHPLAQVHGQVMVDPGATLAPGVTVQADPNATVRLGSASVLQEGTTVYGRTQGRVLGDDRVSYAVWVGDRAFLAYKVLVQSPVYIGPDCFIGFRSTLYNARLGAGCVVMMHALVQDVAVPPGKLVPSGAVITQQHQADSLPDVSPGDRALVNELSETSGVATPTARREPTSSASSYRAADSNERDGFGTMTSQLLPPDVVQRARQYLAQGLTIGTEHADSRRYRSGVWQTCSPIQSNRESEVMAALEACLSEHAGEYVRMFGIDPRAKQRVAPITIQRADGKPVAANGSSSIAAPSSHGGYRPAPASPSSGGSSSSGPLSPEVVQQVRQYLSQGYRIGTEHADARRYSSNVWQTCSPIQSSREGEVFGALERCLSEHSGEYVRLFGIDPQAKRRIAPITIQRPDGRPVSVGSPSGSSSSSSYASAGSHGGSAKASGDVAQQVRQWLNQGFHVGAEHADARRYNSNVWQSCTPIGSTREGEVMAAINTCIAEHPNEYVRVFGIDPKAKRRVSAVTVQRPGSKAAPVGSSGPSYSAPASSPASSNGSAPMGGLSQDLVQQVNQLVNQGYRLSLEHADVRRYRSGAWQTGGALEGNRTSDVLAALESQLRNHSGQYVRLIGIDPKVKKRVLEATIQRP